MKYVKIQGKIFKENIRRMIAIFLILTLSFMPRATAQTVIGDSSSETVSVKDVSSSLTNLIWNITLLFLGKI